MSSDRTDDSASHRPYAQLLRCGWEPRCVCGWRGIRAWKYDPALARARAHAEDGLRADTYTSKPQVVAHDKHGEPICEGDFVSFPKSASGVEGVVYGMSRGVLQIAVPGYGTYGLWPQNAERVERLRRITPLSPLTHDTSRPSAPAMHVEAGQ